MWLKLRSPSFNHYFRVQSHSFVVDAGIPHGSVLSPTLFLLFINLFSTTFNPIHAFADDATLYYSLPYPTSHHITTNIDCDCCALVTSLISDHEQISSRGPENHVLLNASKTSLLSISLKHHSFSPHLNFDSVLPRFFNSMPFIGLSIISLCWSPYICSLFSHATHKIVFLLRARCFFLNQLTSYCMRLKFVPHFNAAVVGGVVLRVE
ncbi:hypothetical protein D915_004887 [Fasciola hepatica]|uniref:Uncharacterized protein n=1 Tax=Fasciola hepatica TaxID=6192 RepID=A0A4E0RDB5_FASHE|nr:hypothetical protein D915_004887 [Fasciola hepatica]